MFDLDKTSQDILGTANKLIFVKEFKKAARLLDELLAHRKIVNTQSLIHLRRIELHCRLSQEKTLRERYNEDLLNHDIDPYMGELCIAMIDQHSQSVSSKSSIKTYSDLILKYGESAAAYYGIALALDLESNTERAIFNYEQSIHKDPNWYPSYFGLSQIYYRKNEYEKGKDYFYLFEKQAPYHLYGNIQTHRNLCLEFLGNKQYKEATIAICSLREWWIQNRQECPPHIFVMECLLLSKISKAQNKDSEVLDLLATMNHYIDSQLLQRNPDTEHLFSIAQILLSFGEDNLCLKIYKHILQNTPHEPQLISELGMQFIAIGALNQAEDLFKTGAQLYPDNTALRFSLLSTRLKLDNISVEDYFQKKNLAKQWYESKESPEKILTLLKEMISLYSEDSEIHEMCGHLYLISNRKEEARIHFSKMYRLDSKSVNTSISYSSFLIHNDNFEEGYRILSTLSPKHMTPQMQAELHALYSHYFAKKRDLINAVSEINLALKWDPWNLEYIIQNARCQMQSLYGESSAIEKLAQNLETEQIHDEEWLEFDKNTEFLSKNHHDDLVYNRIKLRFLSSEGKAPDAKEWIRYAVKFDALKAAHEFIKLLNTNFDSPPLYWVLGVLFREAGSLEIAEMWLEHIVDHNALSKDLHLQVLLDISDCYIWRGVHLQKALAYLKVVRDSQSEMSETANLKMAHAYMKLGEIHLARKSLETLHNKTPSLESTYLEGLLHYRDGSISKAKAVWKPLLTLKAMSIRDHWIKKEILDFYFEGKSYIKNQ